MIKSCIRLLIQLQTPRQSEPYNRASAFLQIQSVSAACRMCQRNLYFTVIPIAYIPFRFYLTDIKFFCYSVLIVLIAVINKVVVHHIVTKGTVDEDVMTALNDKDMGQTSLMEAIKARMEGIYK